MNPKKTAARSAPRASKEHARASKKPASAGAGYSGTPLPKKLGIHPGDRVGLIGAPTTLARDLAPLPENVELVTNARATCDLWIWFPRDKRELENEMANRARRLGAHGIWVCWPKKAAGVATDLSEELIRSRGLALGLVDFKVCALSALHSGLKLTWRKTSA